MLAAMLSVGALMVPGKPKLVEPKTKFRSDNQLRWERNVAHYRRVLARKRYIRRKRLERGVRAARWALSQVGVPYVWGAESPGVGFDCSGLVQWAYSKVGIVLPRTTWGMAGVGRAVSEAEIRPGDIVETYGFEHVVMYVGRGMVVQAPHSGALVGEAPLSWFPINEIRRVT